MDYSLGFDGGLNQDDDVLGRGQYSSATNVVFGTPAGGAGGTGGTIQKLQAHELEESGFETGLTSGQIVAMTNSPDGTLYVLAAGTTNAKLYSLTVGGSKTELLQYDHGSASITTPDMIYVDGVVLWNYHGTGTPLAWKVSRTPATASLEDITLIKAPPIYAPAVDEIYTSSKSSLVGSKQYQFACRYVYDGGEVSVLSPPSALYGGLTGIKSFYVRLNSSEPSKNYVDKIDFFVREGNTGVWKRFKTIDYSDSPVADASAATRGDASSLWTISDTVLTYYPKSEKAFSATAASSTLDTETAERDEITPPSAMTYKLSAKSGEIDTTLSSSGSNYVWRVEVRNSSDVVQAAIEFDKDEGFTYKETEVSLAAEGHDINITWNSRGDGGSEGTGESVLESVVLEPVNTFGFTGATFEALPTDEGSAQFDFIPYDAQALELIGNRVFLANMTEDKVGDRDSISLVASSNAETFGSGGAFRYIRDVLASTETFAKPANKSFANNSRYGFGVVFFDKYLRTRGVEASVFWESPEFDVGVVDLDIQRDATIPSWAEYYQVVSTKNLDKDFIYEGFATGCYFLAESSGGQSSTEQSVVTRVYDTDINKIANAAIDAKSGEDPREAEDQREQLEALINEAQERSVLEEREPERQEVSTGSGGVKKFMPHTLEDEDSNGLLVDVDDVGNITDFVVDIEGMFAAGKPYNFQSGDKITGCFFSVNGSFVSRPILTLDIKFQKDSLIYCDPTPVIELANNLSGSDFIGLNSSNTAQNDLFFEIYSPSKANSQVYYGNGDVKAISNLTGLSLGTSYTETVYGDTYWEEVDVRVPDDYSYEPAVMRYTDVSSVSVDVGASAQDYNVFELQESTLLNGSTYTSNTDFKLTDGRIVVKEAGSVRVRYRATFSLSGAYAAQSGETMVRVVLKDENGNKELTSAIYNHDGSSGSKSLSVTATVQVEAGAMLKLEAEGSPVSGGTESVTVSLDFLYVGLGENVVSDFGFSLSKAGLGSSTSRFIFKSMSPSGDVVTNWNTDRGKPYVEVADTLTATRPRRIRYGGNALTDSGYSRLSTFRSADRVDLDSEFGDITEITRTRETQSDGGVLLAIAENETASIYVGTRIVRDGEGGTQLIQTDRIIGAVNTLAGGFGCKHRSSVIRDNRGRVYWWDENNKTPVRYTREGNVAVNRGLQRYFNAQTATPTSLFDPYYGVWFLMFGTSGIGFDGDKWISFYSFPSAPQTRSVYIDNEAYVTSSTSVYNTQGAAYNSFFGSSASTPSITLVHRVPFAEELQSIGIVTDQWTDWSEENFTTDGVLSVTIDTSNGQQATLTDRFFRLEDGTFYSHIYRDENSGDKYTSDPLKGVRSTIKLDFDDNTISDEVKQVYIKTQPSTGHFGG